MKPFFNFFVTVSILVHLILPLRDSGIDSIIKRMLMFVLLLDVCLLKDFIAHYFRLSFQWSTVALLYMFSPPLTLEAIEDLFNRYHVTLFNV